MQWLFRSLQRVKKGARGRFQSGADSGVVQQSGMIASAFSAAGKAWGPAFGRGREEVDTLKEKRMECTSSVLSAWTRRLYMGGQLRLEAPGHMSDTQRLSGKATAVDNDAQGPLIFGGPRRAQWHSSSPHRGSSLVRRAKQQPLAAIIPSCGAGGQSMIEAESHQHNLAALDATDTISRPSFHPMGDHPSREQDGIHPAAVVHPEAIIAEDVEIGPFCYVGPGAKIGKGCKLHAGSQVVGDTELGERCVLQSGAIVGEDLPGRTVLGHDNMIGHYAVVGVRCQDLKHQKGSECFLEIGNNNDIREHTSIHRSSRPDLKTVIGDSNLIMGSCHVAHDCIIGDRNIMANGTLLAGHVIMQDFVHTGGAVAVHQFCHIGSHAFLAGGSMADRDIPTFTMVAGDRAELRGLNLEGMRRSGFTDVQVRKLKTAYRELFVSNISGLEERLDILEQSELGNDPGVAQFIASIRSSFGEKRRGICKFRQL